MDWILDHLQILIAAAATVAYWLNQRTQAKGETDETPSDVASSELPPEGREPSTLIQERIRRRTLETLENQRGILEQLGILQPENDAVAVPPSLSTPPPLPLPPVRVPEPTAALPPVPRGVKPTEKWVETVSRKSVSSVRRKALKGSLRSTGKIREAILLREILGPPVGLKPSDISQAH